ncbi:MAG: tripartite tricarboxylate transporter substrate binding protein [Burkholderiales bacterium]|nr:tripartite tricarboxylate transporter substrate binding protein [Burkholderiales bacterium]
MLRSRFASPRAASALVAAALGYSALAWAQDDPARSYPNKPVRIVIGLAAGGGIDVITRAVAQRLGEGLGQPVVVENKPGASGIIAAEFVAKAAPDGYTLMMAPSGPMVFNAVMFQKLPYAPVKDFAPVGMVASFPLLAVVGANAPVRSMRELADFARANPAKANYAASTAAFQLATELFNIQAGVRMENISYKGTNESLAAVIAGDVLTTFADSGPASGAIRGGKVRALAVTSPKRMTAFPDVPTMAEAGFAQLDVQLWAGLFAPAATPPSIVRKLEDELGRALRQGDVQQRFATLTVSGGGASGAELGPLIAAEIARWTDVARKAGVKPNP